MGAPGRNEKGLTKAQMNYIEMALANPALSQKKIADMCGLNDTTVARWNMNEPQFQAELERRLAEQWKDAKRMAQDGMIALAEGLDYKALAFILQCNGYNPTSKTQVEANVNADVSINISLGDD